MEVGLRKVLEENASKFMCEIYQQEPSVRFKKAIDQQYWSLTFERVFVSPTTGSHRDDLLFYVKYNTKLKKEEIDVLRKDSKFLPEGADPYMLWDETFYLNFLLHEIEFHLTFCTLLPGASSAPPISRVKNQVSMQVFPSHTERRMDKKSKTTTIGYPNLMFCVDNFTEVFRDITISDFGEKVAVQIIATNPSLMLRRLIFVGGLDFHVLRKACEDKENIKSTSGLSFQSIFHLMKKKTTEFQDLHFIPMSGPNGKGHAEMAVCVSEHFSSQLEEPEESKKVLDLEKDGRTVEGEKHSSLHPKIQDKAHANNNDHPIKLKVNSDLRDHEMVDKDIPVKLKTHKSKQTLLSLNPKNEIIHAYLTYVQLPWYTIIEDILNGKSEPLFDFDDRSK